MKNETAGTAVPQSAKMYKGEKGVYLHCNPCTEEFFKTYRKMTKNNMI